MIFFPFGCAQVTRCIEHNGEDNIRVCFDLFDNGAP